MNETITDQSIDKLEKQQRFASLLKRVYDRAIERKDGSRIRHLMKIVAQAYKDNPEELKPYFVGKGKLIRAWEEDIPYTDRKPNDCVHFEGKDGLVAGIATSAYHYLTGDLTPVQKSESGGLGAIITESPECLEFTNNQLRFARIGGNALKKALNIDDVLQYAETNGNALKESINRGNSLQYSINSGNSLCNSTNYFAALIGSRNTGNALTNSRNNSFSLISSVNSDNSLKNSINTDISLYCSINSGNSLENAKLPDYEKETVELLKHWIKMFYENKYGFEGCGDYTPGDNLQPDRNYFPNYLEIGRIEIPCLRKLFEDKTWPELMAWKIESLLRNKSGRDYSTPKFLRETEQFYQFTLERSFGKITCLATIDKISQEKIHVAELIKERNITTLQSYFSSNVTKEYGLHGQVTIETF